MAEVLNLLGATVYIHKEFNPLVWINQPTIQSEVQLSLN